MRDDRGGPMMCMSRVRLPVLNGDPVDQQEECGPWSEPA